MKTLIDRTRNAPEMVRFLRFLVVGGVNTAVGYLLFSAFILMSMTPQKALAFSFILGVLWNFFAHRKFVFVSKGYGVLPAYALCYVGIYLFNSFGPKYALTLGLNPLLAQAILAPIVAVLSFFLIGRILTGHFPLTKKL